MTDGDNEVTRGYRHLAREAPPPALDHAILAASRRGMRPRMRNRWATPVSIAAVLALGIGVSLRMQTEQPGVETALPERAASSSSAEYPMPQDPPPAALPPPGAGIVPPAGKATAEATPSLPQAEVAREPVQAPPPGPGAAAAQKRLEPATAPKPKVSPMAPPRTEPPVMAAPRSETQMPAAPRASGEAAADAVAPQALREERVLPQRSVATGIAAAPPPPPPAAAAAQARTAELERIARMRANGQHEEADAALEAFRKAHPGFEIPPHLWERVRRR